MMQNIVEEVREEVAGLRSALITPGMPDVADHIFLVERTAAKLLTVERPESPEERAAMLTELELLRNELKRLDDLSRSGQDYCRVFGDSGGYSAHGVLAETEPMGSFVVRG